MADYLPQATGNWSTTTWITAFGGLSAFAGGNTPPTIIDDVYADGKTIYIDINTAVNSIRTTTSTRTGGLAGGGYLINNAVSLTANSIIAGTTTCLTFLSATPSICTVVGNIFGTATTAGVHGLLNNSSGTINIFGNSIGSSISNSTGRAILNNSSGTINMVGNTTGGSGLDAEGIRNASSGTINLTGNCNGGSGASSAGNERGTYGIRNVLNGRINILGNVAGGSSNSAHGLYNQGSGTISITGNVVSGSGGVATVGLYTFTGSTGNVLIYGNLSNTAPPYANSSEGIAIAGQTNLTVFGSVSATASTAINFAGNGTKAIIYGNVHGGTLFTDRVGITNSSSNATIEVYGNVYGGAGSNTHGITNSNIGTVVVSGNVFGGITGQGILNNSAGFVYVYGISHGSLSTGAVGINNASTGLVYATKVVGNGFGLGSAGITAGAVGLANSQNGRAYIEQAEFGSRGQTPISGPVYIIPSNRNTLTGYTTALGIPVTFYNSLSVDGLLPPVSSVRQGTVYNVGNSTGTMAVPSASAVQFGVPVDNTVGTAALTPQSVWGYSRLSATEVDSMGDRLRNTATTQSIGYQIASFNL